MSDNSLRKTKQTRNHFRYEGDYSRFKLSDDEVMADKVAKRDPRQCRKCQYWDDGYCQMLERKTGPFNLCLKYIRRMLAA